MDVRQQRTRDLSDVMVVYMVERTLPGASIESFEAVRRAADAATQSFVAQNKPVRYLRSTFTPGDSRCRCLFEAPNADLVQEVNDAAQLPYNRIVLALDLPSDAPTHDSH
jgi:Protein of unknown function (DUF4242)